ncbi:MAG: ATP-binding protein [Clostridia bacterium]|nr:ATP-binding protein [Clostridia bacterium]
MESYSEAWALVKDYCKDKVSATIYSLWLEPLTMVSFEDNKITLLANTFQAGVVKSKFLDLLNEAFEATMGFPIEIEIISETSPKKAEKEERMEKVRETLSNVNDFTFDNFIVGPSNQFAYAAAQAVAANLAETYNPLFIYGNSGLGKTHLLSAICAEVRKKHPDSKILYLRCEDFTNDLVRAIGTETMPQFHDKYRSADVLLVDDVQFIAGKDRNQ